MELLDKLMWWKKETREIAEPLVVQEEPEPEQSPEPTLEEKLAGALEAEEYDQARDIYGELGQFDRAAEMHVKENRYHLGEQHVFRDAVSMLQVAGVSVAESVTRVFSFYEGERKGVYAIRPMTAFLVDFKEKEEDSPTREEVLAKISSFMDSKRGDYEFSSGALGNFYAVCDKEEKARDLYLQAAERCGSRYYKDAISFRRKAGLSEEEAARISYLQAAERCDSHEYETAIKLRQMAGLSELEAISLTVRERDGIYELSQIAEKYQELLSEGDRRHILQSTEQCRSYDRGRAARIREVFGLKKEAADLYVQSRDEDNLARGLALYSELGDDVNVVQTIVERINPRAVQWAVEQTAYEQERKDLLGAQLHLLQNLSKGKLPSSVETATFLGC